MPIDYLIKRIGELLLVLFVAISVNFIIPRLIPGDPVESSLRTRIVMSGGQQAVNVQKVAELYRAKFGLDKPIWAQYVNYWGDLLRGDLGPSLVDFPETVLAKIQGALPWTLGLLLISTIVAFIIGSVLGALLAWPGASRSIQALVPGLMILSAIPYFLLAFVLIFFLATVLTVFPAGGGFDPTLILQFDLPSAINVLDHAILPALSLVLGATGFWSLTMRGVMVSVLGEDYITFAEAKGLSPRRIFVWYGMRNALLPQITGLAVALGTVLSGAVLVEVIFNYPGLGTLLFTAIAGKDYFVIQGVVLMLIVTLAVALFAVDIVYPMLDPRIRYRR